MLSSAARTVTQTMLKLDAGELCIVRLQQVSVKMMELVRQQECHEWTQHCRKTQTGLVLWPKHTTRPPKSFVSLQTQGVVFGGLGDNGTQMSCASACCQVSLKCPTCINIVEWCGDDEGLVPLLCCGLTVCPSAASSGTVRLYPGASEVANVMAT